MEKQTYLRRNAMKTDEMLLQILKTLNDFKADIKEDINEIKIELKKNEERWKENDKKWEQNEKRWEENNKRWEENNKRWEENEKRWNENQKRWEENDKKWEENNKRWEKYEIQRKQGVIDICNILWSYQTSIEKMFEQQNKRIERLEDLFQAMNV